MDENTSGLEFGSATTQLAAPYFLQVWQNSDDRSDFSVTIDRNMVPYHDPDDAARITVGQTLVATMDYPSDLDYFVIVLGEGDTVDIGVDSAIMDPLLIVSFPGATSEQFITDDDSGGGIFGLNPELTYRAPHSGSYFIVILDANQAAVGGYFLTVAPAPEGAAAVSPPEAAPTIDSPFGPMALYESEIYPFSIQYPAAWTEQPVTSEAGLTALYLGEQNEEFVIAEEEVAGLGLGPLTLSEYVDAVLSVLSTVVPSYELISRQQTVTAQGLPIEMVEISALGGLQIATRQVYLHRGVTGFSATYTAPKSRHEELKDLIDYSFSTLQVGEAPSANPTETPVPASGTAQEQAEAAVVLDRINAAMALVTTLHVDGEIVFKVSKEAESQLVSMEFEGEGDPGPEGDGRTLITVRITSEGLDLTFTFETREVDGVSYTQDPLTEEWEIDEEDEADEEGAFTAVLTGELELENIAVEADSLDGSRMYRVTGNVPDDPEAEHLTLWAGIDDLVVRQVSIEGLVLASEFEGLVPQDREQLYQSQEYRLSKFNDPVEVVAPLVKAVPTLEPTTTPTPAPASTATTVDLSALPPTLADLGEGASIELEGFQDDPDTLSSYVREFAPEGLTFQFRSSTIMAIETTVELHAGTFEAQAPVLVLNGLDVDTLQDLFGLAFAEGAGFTPSGVEVTAVDVSNVGDAAFGVLIKIETAVGNFDAYLLFFARGRVAAQVLVMGPGGQVTSEDVVTLGQLIDERANEEQGDQ